MFVAFIYSFAIALLVIGTAKTLYVNLRTFRAMKNEGRDPFIARPGLAAAKISNNMLLFNWFNAAAVGHYLFG